MPEKLSIDRPVIVEGKYDKIKLLSVINANIITTDGFGVFKDSEKRLLIKRLAEKKGVIVLTDSDGGGLVIRNYISSVLPKEKIINLYVPEIKGKEKRKTEPSREGLLGVEGIDTEVLYSIFLPFSSRGGAVENTEPITKTDFYTDGLSGGEGSAERRRLICKKAGLPTNLSANSLLEALNMLYGREKYKELVRSVQNISEEI